MMTYSSRVFSAPGFPKQMQYNIRNYSFKKIMLILRLTADF